MKPHVLYRGFEIRVSREPCLAGYMLLYYSVIRVADGYICVDSYEDSNEAIPSMVRKLKARIDAELAEDDPWGEHEDTGQPFASIRSAKRKDRATRGGYSGSSSGQAPKRPTSAGASENPPVEAPDYDRRIETILEVIKSSCTNPCCWDPSDGETGYDDLTSKERIRQAITEAFPYPSSPTV